MSLSIRTKLIGFTFGIILLVSGAICAYSIYQGRRSISTTFEKESRETTALITRTLANDLYFLDVSSLQFLQRQVSFRQLGLRHGTRRTSTQPP